MEKMKERKQLIRQKVSELDQKYDEYCDICGYWPHNTVRYRLLVSACGFSIPITLIVMLVVSVLFGVIFHNVSTILRCMVGSMVGIAFSVCVREIKSRRTVKHGGSATITIFFYNQKLLDEICTRIVSVEEDLKAKKHDIAEQRARRIEKKMRIAINEARENRPKFESLFGIIRHELGGQIKPVMCSDENGKEYESELAISLIIPVLDWGSYSLSFQEEVVEITEQGLRNLTARIAMLRCVMTEYYSLQKVLDTAVPAEQ